MARKKNAIIAGLSALGAAVLLAGGLLGTPDQQDHAANQQQSASQSQSATHSAPQSKSANAAQPVGQTCPADSLPVQAQQQIDDILDGAPSDDGPHDGKHFGNYEGLLPKEPSNYYREYTVKTPGLNHRGLRRIVVGGGTETDPEVWYYSDDHYKSFCTIPTPH